MDKYILIISFLTLLMAVQVQTQVNAVFDLLENAVWGMEIDTEVYYK